MIIQNRFIRISCLLSATLVAPFLHATPPNSNVPPVVFTGEIMDSLCAKDGSHEQMMQDMKSMGRDKATCAAKCIQLGAKYVLYDSSKGAVYKLDDQDKAERFAGRKVRVSGTLEKKTTIKVASIEAAD